MFQWLLAAFIIVPLVELYVLIKVGGVIGAPYTILLVVITAVLGANIARNQGLMVLSTIRDELNQGIAPGDSLIEGFLVLAGGLLLLTPGFITDLTGFLLLIPNTRRIFSQWVRKGIYNYLLYRRRI